MAHMLDAPQEEQAATAAQGLRTPALPVVPASPATPKAPGVPSATPALPVAGPTAAQGMPSGGSPVGTSDPMAFSSPLTNPIPTNPATLSPLAPPGPAQLAPRPATPSGPIGAQHFDAQGNFTGYYDTPAYRDFSGELTGTPGTDVSSEVGQLDAARDAARQEANTHASARAASDGFYRTEAGRNATALPDRYYDPADTPSLPGIQSQLDAALKANGFGGTTGGPTDVGGAVAPGAGGSGTPRFTVPNGPSDVGSGGSTSNPGSLPVAHAAQPGAPGVLPVASADPRVGRGVATTPTTPENALTNSTISVDPGVDRVKVAGDIFDQFAKSSDPAYQATLRAQDAHDFGAGRGVSGMHKNSIGDIATQRANALDTERKTLIDNATTGTIGDAKDAAALAVQQQGFQRQQGQDAFGNAVAAQNLSDSESQQAFYEALQQALVGAQGDPAALKLALAQIYGGQSVQDSAAAANLERSRAA